MNRLAPTLPTSCGSLPPEGALRLQSGKAGPAALAGEKPLPLPCFAPTLPEGAAPPAVRQSRSCGRNLDGRGRKSAPLEAVGISVSPAYLESQIRGRNLNERSRRVPCLKL